jgi:hypothetical protein
MPLSTIGHAPRFHGMARLPERLNPRRADASAR